MSHLEAGRGLHKLQGTVNELLAVLDRIRARYGIDVPVPWWTDRNHPDYDLVFRAFIAPYKGAVRVSDIEKDPLSFDQALRELKVCRECTATKVRMSGDRVVGMADCPLGKPVLMETGRTKGDGRPEMVPVRRGADSAYSDIRRTSTGWQWEMVSCTDSEARRNEISERLAQWRRPGGIKARPVDVATPFDRQQEDLCA